MPDALSGEPLRVKGVWLDGVFVHADGERERMAANLEKVQERHPELVRRARTEEERTLLTAKKAFARYGDSAIYKSRHGTVTVYRARFSVPQHRGTTRAVRSTRRVRAVDRVNGTSSGTDPPKAEGDDDPPPEHHHLARVCAVCGKPLPPRARRHKTTCDYRCRKRLERRRRAENVAARRPLPAPNGDGNGNGTVTSRERDWLRTPRGHAWLRDKVARACLEDAGGFAVVERAERDLARSIAKANGIAEQPIQMHLLEAT
jgi:hypothetical protein